MFTAAAVVLALASFAVPVALLGSRSKVARFLGFGLALDAIGQSAGLLSRLVADLVESV